MVPFGNKIFIAVWLLGFVLSHHHVCDRMDTLYLLGSKTFPCWGLTSSVPHTLSRAFSQTWRSVEKTAHHWEQVEDTFQMDGERSSLPFLQNVSYMSLQQCSTLMFLFSLTEYSESTLLLETKEQKKTVFEIHMITQ